MFIIADDDNVPVGTDDRDDAPDFAIDGDDDDDDNDKAVPLILLLLLETAAAAAAVDSDVMFYPLGHQKSDVIDDDTSK